jgi:hypothetical protein
VRPRPLREAERLEPIGLEALDATAALRRRFDTKYLLSREAVVELLGRIEQTHRVLDINGLRDFEYRTTYFDTRELGAFRDHLQGRRRRLKARVRHYVETGACFFELKLRGPRESTIKRRLPHAVGQLHQLTPESLATLERWVRDAYGRPAPSPLAPTLAVAFRRTTLVAPQRGERLTIDVDLRLSAPGSAGWGRLHPELAIVESKSAVGVALAARELRALGARRLESMSKYCLGVVLVHGHARGNSLLPVLRHCDGRRAPVGAMNNR